MLSIASTSRFDKDLRKMKKRGENLALLFAVVTDLANEISLPPKNHDHTLSGNWLGFRECHIRPDWLLVYKIDGGTLMLYRTGTHSDLDF